MRTKSLLLAAATVLTFSAPALAQGSGNTCDISGTWYGGGDPQFQYLLTITPIAAGRYYSNAQPGFDNHPAGYVSWTNWTGEATRTGGRTFDLYEMSYWTWDPDAAAAAGVDPTLPEVDAVRGRVQLVDCNTMTITIDVYAVYFSFTPDKTPFVTPPDLDVLQGGTIVETYHRMPTACPACPYPPSMSTAAAPALKPGHKPRRH
jgi:hypothetical protein